jgi:hypothetical protein
MRILKRISILMLTSIFMMTTSCSKYEEGPAISLLPKKTRLVGTWKVDKIVDEDGDVENVDNNSTYEFTKDNEYNVVLGNINYSGEWSFTKEKEYLQLTYSAGALSYSSEDKILRLKNDELWLLQGDDEYHYVPAD